MADKSAGAAEGFEVFVCDLAAGLSEETLRQTLRNYGDIVSLKQINAPNDDAALVGFASQESAEEAQSMLNHAILRHKTCRCLLSSSVDVIRQTMETGQRLVVENLDPAIESRGLLDVCELFGQILDCKVELDEEDRSRGYGFAHFAVQEEASHAKTFMDGSKIGESVIEVRRFEAKDLAMFTGCIYPGGEAAASAEGAAAEVSKEADDADGEGSDSRGKQILESLQAHHVEVIEDISGKLERLKDLTKLYNPNQEQQMVVIAESANLEPIGKLMGEIVGDADFESVSFSTSDVDRKEAFEGFETGNTFVLLLAGDVASRQDFDVSKKAAVLINFDLPGSFQAYHRRMQKRADVGTRAHSFFLPESDHKLAVPLMQILEEAGQEIPQGLIDCMDM